MWNRIKTWWAAEGALVGLQGVGDRMLADMGLEREGLRNRVLGSPARPEPEAPLAPVEAVPCRCRRTLETEAFKGFGAFPSKETHPLSRVA